MNIQFYRGLIFLLLYPICGFAQSFNFNQGEKYALTANRCHYRWTCFSQNSTINLEVFEASIKNGLVYHTISSTAFRDGWSPGDDDIIIRKETVFYRTSKDSIFQWTENGDSLIQYLTIGSDKKLQHSYELGNSFTPPTYVQVDTTIEFPNGRLYRVFWGIEDSSFVPEGYSFSSYLVDSLMIEFDDWLIPLRPLFEPDGNGAFVESKLSNGFYFIDGIGAVGYPYNLGLQIRGYISAEGDTTGYYRDPKITTSTEPVPAPLTFSLHQNYPNPFNPTTTITYDLHEAGFVELTISDVSGRILKTLISNNQSAGHHHQTVDLSGFASGVYFYTLQTTNGSLQKQMTLVK